MQGCIMPEKDLLVHAKGTSFGMIRYWASKSSVDKPYKK